MLEEFARGRTGTFTRQELYSWFRRHYPQAHEPTISAYVQGLTSNAPNRARNSPGIGSRPPMFDRVDRGLYAVRKASSDQEASVHADATTGLVRPPSGNPDSYVRPARDEWHWEGLVQARVVAYLAASGVSITRVAGTASREHGTDIEGTRDGVPLHVEVKGWPSERYVDPARAHEVKKTPPSLMARTWFADGVVQVLRLRAAHRFDEVGLALPAIDTYRRLVTSIRPPLEAVRISVLWVSEDGGVVADGPSTTPAI
jgi:hypothetical protein